MKTYFDNRIIAREFFLESVHEDYNKLRIVDFDDTIANTAERVRIETPDGHKMVSSAEFATYDLLPGETIDKDLAFDEFDQVDIDGAQPIPLVSNLFKTFADASGSRKLLVLTARNQIVEPFIRQFLKVKLGIKDDDRLIDVIGVGNKDPIEKVKIIQKYVEENPSIEFISFYDDSGKNTRAVKDFINKTNMARHDDEKIRDDIATVVRDDDTGEVSLQRVKENRNINMREMIRDFLDNS
jgi:hypothetical protein